MQFICCLALVASLLFIAPEVSAQEPSEATLPESAPAVYQQSPLAQRITAADVLGGGQGYVHPFLSIGEFYTDNLFNTPDDEESEWITVISPGIWVSVPSTRQPTLDRETVNTAPGGLQLSQLRYVPERRFQGYALYRADLREHAEFPEEETDTHRAEGLLYYRLRGGLAFELMDLYKLDQDPYNTNIGGSEVTDLDEFSSNLLRFSVSYPFTPKLSLDASYGMFNLDYDADRNAYRDRDDQTAAISVYFRVLPKTALVLDYQFLDVNYDSDESERRDNNEHRFMGGVRWDMTAKTTARLLLGYGDKEFDEGGSEGDFIGEARVDYNPTEKTKLYVRAVRRANETDVGNAQDILTHRVQAGYAQLLSARWSGAIDAYYINDDYRSGEGFSTDREDDRYSAALTLGYAFRRWLSFLFGYSYIKRDSNSSEGDYDTNNFFATVSATL